MGGNERGHSLRCKYSRLGSIPRPFYFLFLPTLHDLFDLLSINQRRMYLNELEVYLRKPLYGRGCLHSPFTFPGSAP